MDNPYREILYLGYEGLTFSLCRLESVSCLQFVLRHIVSIEPLMLNTAMKSRSIHMHNSYCRSQSCSLLGELWRTSSAERLVASLFDKTF